MTPDASASLNWGGSVAGDSGRFWGVAIQTVDPAKVDQYLESVSDQEGALAEAIGFSGRLVLRSQRSSERFWLIDGWSDQRSLETASITLRTLSSVAGLVAEPRVIGTVELPIGSRSSTQTTERGAEREPGQLPFYLIAENWIKSVSTDEYLEMQQRFSRDLEEEPGYGRRMLLRDLKEATHYLVLDEWASEQLAFEAFERRQESLSQMDMQRFLGFMRKRGEPDFALGIHG